VVVPEEMTMAEFDKGPPAAVARHLSSVPGYAPEHRALFWYDWGPVFYRGRLDGRARFLGIASDPGPTERVVGRTLVGDAGQRVQGFLRKVGLTSSYALVNAFPYAVHPSDMHRALPLLALEEHLRWRNRLLDLITGPELEVIVAFGGTAQEALRLWDRAPDVRVHEVPHPSSRNEADLQTRWAAAVTQLRASLAPDPDGDPIEPNYGATFTETDYAPIPARDLPFGLPGWMGDDSWGRLATPKHHNAVSRPREEPDHTIVWQAPPLNPRPPDPSP
jgi:uracil-DNA glycosylase